MKPNPFPPDKRLFSLAALIWLLSPATQALFLGVPLPGSPLVAPSSFGERVFSLAYVVLEHMGWWLWPFGRDWVLRPLDPHGLFAINLLFWLILVLMLRHGNKGLKNPETRKATTAALTASPAPLCTKILP